LNVQHAIIVTDTMSDLLMHYAYIIIIIIIIIIKQENNEWRIVKD